jgi:signal transduction histidine kinase
MTLNLDYIKTQVDDEIKEILEEIEAAVTMLNNSYEDLSYLAGNGVLKYEAKEEIDISEVLKERIKFFEAVAKANNKKIVADIEDGFKFKINKVELDRIIDNNLSNAIKYSSGSEIFVEFGDGVLKFKSFSERIKGGMRVFEKSYREHSHKRGLGIGLNIVKEICEKYGIEYKLYYEDGKNVFEYNFGKISKKG